MKTMLLLSCLLVITVCLQAQTAANRRLYEFDGNSSPRWSSFENIGAEKGKGGMENNGAKGHPSDAISAGETKVLLNTRGPGIINRIWITINDRSPRMLRSLKLEIYWDDATDPAVSVPFGDFFGMGLGKTAVFHNALFANPEGRSFQCFIPMPFKKAARVQVVNESGKRLSHLFFDINFERLTTWNSNYMYLHSYWHRDTATVLAKDFELLPQVEGKGRFLGVNIGVNSNPVYEKHWWGEGEVKIYLDGDKAYPTLVGTGAEDYIGTGWGQGEFFNDYAGCLLGKDSLGWAFYRYHIPDPVYFKSGCRVTIQQMGSNRKDLVAALQQRGVPMIPATIDDQTRIVPLYHKDSVVQLSRPGLPDGYAMFYRSDDVSSTAYFYLDSPAGRLPKLQGLEVRTKGLR